ncbi:MAG: D-alanyl-D-alanine carboxypeptidase family protein [Kofleriaceae bacterium]
MSMLIRARWTSMLALVVACGGSPSRAGSPEPSTPPSTQISAQTPPAADAEAAPAARIEPPPAPKPTLAWVNPSRCLTPCAYEPPNLVQVDDLGVADSAGKHLVDGAIQIHIAALVAAGRAAGHKIYIASAFRPYNEQALLFRRTKQPGRAARPGHSEHQLGTAVDIELPTKHAIAWLAEHAHEHGFALSYPDGKQRITGYRPEPWHVRFVGPELADEVRKNGWSLEELFRARPELGVSGNCDDCSLPSSRAACGSVTAAGRCKQTVLEWCYDGALAAVDCEASKQTCGRDRAENQNACMAPN